MWMIVMVVGWYAFRMLQVFWGRWWLCCGVDWDKM
jgi:hypothetical protein